MDAQFIDNFRRALGDNLLLIAAYGRDDAQYLIVTEKLDFNSLHSVQNLVREFNEKTGKFPLFLTREELRDGLDVFPLEFLNMKLNHEILWGDDLLSSLKFDKKYVRRELEFEFRSKLINLRQGYLEVAKSRENLMILVKKSVPTLMPICNGLLFLKDIEVPKSTADIFEAVSVGYDADSDILKRIYETDIEKLSEADIKEYIGGLMILLSDLGGKLDEMRIWG